MTADVVERFHRAGLIAKENHAVAAAELEHEVVARLGNAAFVVDEQPDVVGEEPLIGQIALLVEVILRWQGGSHPPSVDDLRGTLRRGRLSVGQRDAVASVGDRVAAVGEAGWRQRDPETPRRFRALRRGGRLALERRFADDRAGKDHRRGTGRHRRPGKITTADFLAHDCVSCTTSFMYHWTNLEGPPSVVA